MKKLVLFLCVVLLFPVISQAQCPTSNFTFSAAGCAGQAINFTNKSTGAVSYKWDFCSGDFDSSVSISVFDTSGFNLNTPFYVTPVTDGANHYAFVCNHDGASLTRIDFGSSFNNTPVGRTDLGNPLGLLSQVSGIAFVEDSGIWHALVTNNDANQVVQYDFGNGINSIPTTGAAIVNTNLSGPRGIDIAVDTAGNIFAGVANITANTITILSFGNSMNNTVTVGSPISIPNSSGIVDLSFAHECGNWYAFITSFTSGEVYRADFGNSLLNIPANIPSVISSLNSPIGISVVNENANWVACVASYNTGNISRYAIGSTLSNTAPTLIRSDFVSNDGILGLKMIKENSDWFGFTITYGNSFERTSFVNACSVNTSVSDSLNPSTIIYSEGGIYNVALEAIDAGGNISYSTQQFTINALPQVNFSVQNICFSDTTAFSDSSTIAFGAIVGRHWDFGDGGTSGLPNPTHIYAANGAYTVSLTDSSDFGCTSTLAITVTITSKPVANFSAPSPICAKASVQFSDSSTISSGSITEWHWDFGDNDTSNIENPLYAYPAGGGFNAILTVTSDSGCSASRQMNMTIYDLPNTDFLSFNTCRGDSVNFIDESSISSGSINAWSWNFGDGDSSKLRNPVHFYPNSVATYDVSLVATSGNGCSDTLASPVKINNIPVSSFSFLPATICEGNAVNYTDLSTVAGDTIYAWHWDFGDGDTSTLQNPTHAYATFGYYTIVLTVYSQTSCGASSTQMVTVVKSPAAGFSYALTCLGDSTYFSDTSMPVTGTTINAWHWDFGNGDTSNVASPVYFYDSTGTYTVTLSITDNIGCNNIFASPVIVHQPPVAAFNGTTGCTSTALTFFDASTSSDGTIDGYVWNFGDPASGSNNSSSNNDPSHTYYLAGSYSVTLTVTSTSGCSATADSTVTINQSSAANFNYYPSCEKEQTQFTNQDSTESLDSLWAWTFGDVGGTSSIESPSHYYLFPGIYDVTLTVTSTTGCVNSITKLVEVYPNPVANFVTAPGCINSPYSFQDISTVSSGNVEAWQWSFGNGDSSNLQSPQTIYTDTGDYVVSLNVATDTVGGCTDFISQTIHIYPLPVANFYYFPLFGSPPLNITFNDQSGGAAVYLWTFGDGDSSTSPTPSHTYTDTGKYTITQRVYSAEGCADSLSRTIYVIKPSLDIAVTAVSYQLNNNQFRVSAQVANLGTRDITSYHMQASIQDGATLDEYVTTPLLSGSQPIIYNFTAAFEISPEQNINYYCANAVSPDGETDDNPANNEKCATLTSDFTVVQPYPNPFSDQLQLQFILPYKGHLTAELFDNIGKKISTLYDEDSNAGGTIFQVSTAALENEIYFCRFTFGDQTLVYPIVKVSANK